ncbi:terminase family protein [bacterium]|nr:terminase family protein [bacterium]MDB0072695.1 terminase family protein [bacterium]MDB4235127.1 terminase family protein [bacterium]MDB4277866.1 terminase family protein [Gammaproteobacteria bacterium]MDB4351860.1 terminase family protein [Porticoccaceae bacterium]
MANLTKEQILVEYVRCQKSTPYALKTYLETYDNTVKKYVPLELFPDQESLVNDYEEYNENIALKYRQAGVTTVTAGWASKKLVFAKKTEPEKVLIIANKLDTSQEMANKIRSFIGQWPSWLGVDFSLDKNSQKHFKLTNGCEVKAVATSKDALRGFTPTILIFDEAAFIEADTDFWAACMASLSTGGKVIVVSTPNGFDQIYYEIYDQSNRGMNEFKISEMYWYRDPRYTKDLYMVKTNNIIHYLLNKEQYSEDDIIDWSDIKPSERNYTDLDKLISEGYKTSSSWFESMVKKLKYDKRKVSQEIECSFLGSGDNVFDSNLLQDIKENHVREPQNKMMGNMLWIWKEPVVGHKYIMGIDVSRGDSEDFSSIEIIDFDAREQVLEYVGKVPPDVIAEIAFKWANMYKSFVVIDITGGMGVATARKLQEMGYKDLYVDGIDTSNKWKYVPKSAEKIPGLNFNNKRVQIISSFEESMRHDFRIYSSRLYDEMNTFIYINGRPDHQKGHHDDLIMSIAMCTYVGESSFGKLTKVTEQTKAMIDSWSVSSNNDASKKLEFNPVMPNMNQNIDMNRNRQGVSKDDYVKYGWLFGGR